MGFNFLITDGQNQRGPDWFSVNMKDEASETENSKIDATQPTTRSSSTSTTELKTWTDGELPRLEKNAKLSAAPGIPSPIGPEFLKAVSRTVRMGRREWTFSSCYLFRHLQKFYFI